MTADPASLGGKLWSLVGSVSVRTKIMGIVLGLVLLLGLRSTFQVRSAMESALVERQEEQSASIARDLASRSTDLILISDIYGLHQILVETVTNNGDIRYAFLVDSNGDVIAHTFDGGFPRNLLTANVIEDGLAQRTTVLQSDEGRIWDTAVPIFDGRTGTARVGLSEDSLVATMESVTGQMMLTTLFVSAVGIAGATLLTWIVTRPILQLKQATQMVGHGDFSQRVRPWSGDEIGELSESFNRMTADLAAIERVRSERELLRSQLLDRVISAQEEERQRIARELHDETGQALTSLTVRLQSLAQDSSSSKQRRQIGEVSELASQALEDVHRLALELRPSVLDDLGLVAALQRYVSDHNRRSSTTVDLVTVGLDHGRLPSAVETALYRIVQEGLTNIIRHAEAESATVMLKRHDGQIRVIIEDDGKGFDPQAAESSSRLGLYGMRERAELLGGELMVESTPGRGTTLCVEVPL